MPLSSSFRNTWRKIQCISQNRNILFSEKGNRKRELCLTTWQWNIWVFTASNQCKPGSNRTTPHPDDQNAAELRQNFPMSSDSLRKSVKGAGCGIFTETRDSSHQAYPGEYLENSMCQCQSPAWCCQFWKTGWKKALGSFLFYSVHVSRLWWWHSLKTKITKLIRLRNVLQFKTQTNEML